MAKPGKSADLQQLLLGWEEELDLPMNPIVSVPLGGQFGAVRFSIFAESLQALEDIGNEIAANPRSQQVPELINGPVMRSVARITYTNQP